MIYDEENERKEANKTCSVGGGPLSSMSVARVCIRVY